MDLEKKIDLISQKISKIEEHLGIDSKSIYGNMKEAYSVKDTSKILGCTEYKVRQYIKYEMLKTFKVGHKKMITSESLKELIKNNSN